VRFLTNSSGTAGNTYTLDAFGDQIAGTGSTSNAYLYSGERLTAVSTFINCVPRQRRCFSLTPLIVHR
jgi:hypothetical protein